ncbi:MAG: TIGR04086 family membrane protein, partial [Oscillospiraceae bacterium]|nr:TIGR04086 family membrane protein [Oscillospiraceae bacterium]
MLQKILISAKPWQKYMMTIILHIIVCIAILTFLLSIAAFTLVRIDTPDYILVPLTTLLLTAASFMDAFLLGKVYKEKGAVIGISVGFVFSFLITVISIYYGIFSLSSLYITKLCAV